MFIQTDSWRKTGIKYHLNYFSPLCPRKNVFISVPVHGNVASELTAQRLRHANSNIFYAANVHIVFLTSSVLRTGGKDRIPLSATSMCLYKFPCSCRAAYIRRTTKRIKEHYPSWLEKGDNQSIASNTFPPPPP